MIFQQIAIIFKQITSGHSLNKSQDLTTKKRCAKMLNFDTTPSGMCIAGDFPPCDRYYFSLVVITGAPGWVVRVTM